MLHAPLVAGEGLAPSPIRLRALSLGAGGHRAHLRWASGKSTRL